MEMGGQDASMGCLLACASFLNHGCVR